MSNEIARLIRTRHLSRRFVRDVLGAPDRLKKTALELARTMPKRSRGGYTLTEAADYVRRLWKLYDEARKARQHYQPEKAWPCGSPIDRLLRRLRWYARSMQRCYRSYARQPHPTVARADVFSDACVTLTKEMGWVEYSRRFGNRYGVVNARYHFVLARGWLQLPDWIRECNGMATVAAFRCPDLEDADEGEQVWRARWGVQRRDDVETVAGWIVRQEINGRVFTAHGKTVGAARGCITTQLPSIIAARTQAGRDRAERIDRIKARISEQLENGRLNGYGDVLVTLADSRRAGNCPVGTEHWVARHFPGRDSAAVAEVMEIADQRERVLMACLAAIRRQRPHEFTAE